MKDDQRRFLSLLGQLPVRITAEQAGWVLNCQQHDISGLDGLDPQQAKEDPLA